MTRDRATKNQSVIARYRRHQISDLLNRKGSFSEVAKELGMNESDVRRVWKKQCEVRTAEKFLESTELLDARIETLKEFAGIESCPSTNRDLDDICPDVVALGDGLAIGLELTAYGGEEAENRLFDIRCQVNQAAREEFSGIFPELKSFHVFWDPNEQNILSKAKVRDFAQQLLDFVKLKHTQAPYDRGEKRRYPDYCLYSQVSPFTGWHLLQNHVRSVSAVRSSGSGELPVSVSPGSSTCCRGTSVELISTVLRNKITSLKKAYKTNINVHWLLIHATRDPISSDIYPLFPQEIERLLNSEVGRLAKQSAYTRVILWDGVDGGWVDLRSGEACPVEIQ